MLRKYSEYLSKPILRGDTVEAVYHEQIIAAYKDNPFIEALRPIMSPDEAKSRLCNIPVYDPAEKDLPTHYRTHCVDILKGLLIPFNRHIEVEQCVSRMIRQGYVGRNPVSVDFVKQLNKISETIQKKGDIEQLKNNIYIISTASSQIVLGPSGIGKSKTFELVLLTYAQVIVHKRYKGKPFFNYQIVWLKVDCPFDGGIRALCLKILKSIDDIIGTNYFEKHDDKNVAILILIICGVALNLGLGILIIDEIQNLREAKSSDADKMLNFFVDMINTAGFSMIFIGTPEAKEIFSSKFQDSRRGTGEIPPMWDRMPNDREWDRLTKELWKYQWTKKESPLTEKIKNRLYYESQGIIDIAVKLYRLAQIRAISNGNEIVDSNTIWSVSKDCLDLVRPMLDVMKPESKTNKNSKPYIDLILPERIVEEYQQSSSNVLELYEKAKQLESSYNSKIPENKLSILSNISNWLIMAGYTADDSIKCAQKVLLEDPECKDITLLRQKAYYSINQTLIIQNDTPSPKNTNKNTKSKREHNSKKDKDTLSYIPEQSDTTFPDILQKKYVITDDNAGK